MLSVISNGTPMMAPRLYCQLKIDEATHEPPTNGQSEGLSHL